MKVRTLEMPLRTLDPPEGSGYYWDSVTGQQYYYDALSGKWYYYSAGLWYPLAIAEQNAPTLLSVAGGDTVRIYISYNYSGPASSGVEEYFSIGYKDVLGYHPKIVGTNTRNLPSCPTAGTFTSQKDLVIPAAVGSDWNHIECKVWKGSPSVPETGLRYLNALQIVGITAAITNFTIVNYVRV